MARRRLTPAQEQDFLRHGFLHIPNAVDPEVIERGRAVAWQRLGMRPDDPTTWTVERLQMPATERLRWAHVAPVAWDLVCDLLGGEDRILPTVRFDDGIIANFRRGGDAPWEPPSPSSVGWHKDGNWFRHFLDSPEHALMALVLWTDLGPRGGGTFLAPDSIPAVARRLRDAPRGLVRYFGSDHVEGRGPDEFDFASLVGGCRDFRELTGKAGDLVLIHPFMLHAPSNNPSGIPRFITNPSIQLREPLSFDRSDPAELSVLERSILAALGVARLDFRIAAARERFSSAHHEPYARYQRQRTAAS